MKSAFLLVFTGLCGATWILSTAFASPAWAKDTIEVVRDKDKTSYVIESDDSAAREEERDKQNAWRMLQNGNMWIDGRGKRQGAQAADK